MLPLPPLILQNGRSRSVGVIEVRLLMLVAMTGAITTRRPVTGAAIAARALPVNRKRVASVPDHATVDPAEPVPRHADE